MRRPLWRFAAAQRQSGRKMKPTIFRATPHPFGPQRYLARGRQFRRVAMHLADMDGPEPNWPKYFLVTHAIELAIKAYIISREGIGAPAPAMKPPADHDRSEERRVGKE